MKTFREIVDGGPPKEPTLENPGPLLKTLSKFEELYRKDHDGEEMPAKDMVGLLAHFLDVSRWKSELEAYNSVVERFKSMLP